MYCQACAAEIQPGISYCSRCGTPVSVPPSREVLVPVDLTSPVRWVSATVGLTFLVGLVIIFTAIADLSRRGLNSDNVMAIAFAGMVTLGCVELSLIRLLSRLLGVSKERGTLANMFRRSKELKTPQPQQQFIQPAPAYTDPLPSVTEHTTRTFAAAYREPRAKN